ncbi:MAG: hypothetical protein QF535_17495, partial [Anaerolineales bacterium]|nr:hypothetical protein [Anaerolineales bacterium]
NLVSVSYDNPGATPERTQPYPKDTPIPLRLTFEDETADADLSKVTLLDNGTIDITLNVGTPSTIVSFSQSDDPEFGQTTDASATGNEDYTVASDEYTTAALTVTDVSVSNDLVLRDKAGNPITAADLTADFNAGTFTNLSGLFVDGTAPDEPIFTSISVTNNPVSSFTISTADCNCAAFWNEDAEQATFTYTIETVSADPSMENGKLYVYARTSSNPYVLIATKEDISSDQANIEDPIAIDIATGIFDALNWWPTTPADVDFKFLAEDWAGNTTLTGDGNKQIIHVDEVDPSALTIVSLETSINNSDGNSTTVEGYWNIDTDRLKVTLSDADNNNFSNATDHNIIGGQVQLYADVSTPGVGNTGWVLLGAPQQITTVNRAAFFIEVDNEV